MWSQKGCECLKDEREREHSPEKANELFERNKDVEVPVCAGKRDID